jgi:hypothetical protein
VGLTTLPCKKKIVEKPPRNSAGFCGGGQGLGWAVEPRKEGEEEEKLGSNCWNFGFYSPHSICRRRMRTSWHIAYTVLDR